MAARIDHHRARRPQQWQSVEEPLALAATLRAHAGVGRCLVVDCLTLWLGNLLGDSDSERFARERDALVRTLPALPGRVILVSNEVGQGIVPLGALSRRFVDEAGWLHQALAQRCANVALVVAGLPLWLKGARHERGMVAASRASPEQRGRGGGAGAPRLPDQAPWIAGPAGAAGSAAGGIAEGGAAAG